MRIDTDLITYLSHVIVPEQMIQQQLAKRFTIQTHKQVKDEEVSEQLPVKKFIQPPNANDIRVPDGVSPGKRTTL